MIPKFDLKPENPAKIKLFANTAEAVVFWLALAGLIFLAIVSFFRYQSNKQVLLDQGFRQEMQLKTEQLESQNLILENQIDSLRLQVQEIKGALEDTTGE
ncbi:MAG: hypothetical protein ACE5IR_01500 [bacterium]